MAARPELGRSPAMAGGDRRRPRPRPGRRGRPPRPLLVLRQLAVVRPRRPRYRPTTGPDRHRRAPVPRGSGQQLRHPRAGGHGRDPPRRSRLARTGDRDRHAHGAATRPSLWSTRPGPLVRLPTRPARPPPVPSPWCPRQGAGHRATFSPGLRPGGAQSTALICDLPDGGRAYARMDEPSADAEGAGCGTTVHLTPGIGAPTRPPGDRRRRPPAADREENVPIHYEPRRRSFVRSPSTGPRPATPSTWSTSPSSGRPGNASTTTTPPGWPSITGVGPDFCVGADLKTYIPQITALAEPR